MTLSNANAKPTRLSCKLKPALARKSSTAYAARGHDNYIGAVMKYGHPRQPFAQRTPISAIAHYTHKASNNDRGTALGLHGGQRWRMRRAEAKTRARRIGNRTAGRLSRKNCENPPPKCFKVLIKARNNQVQAA